MFKAEAAYSSFSVDDLAKAKKFYVETLGLTVDKDEMGLTLNLPDGGSIFMYEKENHEPATFTILNLVVEDIDEAVDELVELGVHFEHYEDFFFKQDEKEITRGRSVDKGPDIAWFKDPAGNILAVLQN